MALGFQRQGIFGRRNPMDMQPQSQAMPQANAMPIGVEQITKKPGFFGKDSALWKVLGTLGDTFSDGPPIYTESVLQQRDAEERARMAQQQRMQKREDMQWEWQNKPKEVPNNDTINDFNWYSGLTEEQRKLYHQMKPVVGYMADGTPRIINPYEAQKPTMQPGVVEDGYRFKGGDPADPNAWEKVGGSGGNVTGGFRR